MALLAGQVTIEHREILLKDRPEALYSISKKGTVPVLYIDSSTIIDESLDIMIWVIDKCSLDWLEYDKKIQLEKIAINDLDFKYWLDRYKYHDRYPESSYDFYQQECKIFLLQYESLLENNTFLCGDKLQGLDIAVFPLIRQCAHIDIKWFEKELPSLYIWLELLKSSSLFLSIMHKFPIWNQKDKGIITNYKNL